MTLVTILLACLLCIPAFAQLPRWETLCAPDAWAELPEDSAIGLARAGVEQVTADRTSRAKISACLRLANLYGHFERRVEGLETIIAAVNLRDELPLGDSLRIQVCFAVSMLRQLSSDQDTLAQAVAHLEEALDGCRNSVWCDTSRFLNIAERMATLSRSANLWQEVLNIENARVRPDKARIARVTWECYRSAVNDQRFDEAEFWTNRLDSLQKSDSTIAFPSQGMVSNASATNLMNAGDLPGAIRGFEQSLLKLEHEFGPRHCRVARSLLFLGDCLRDIGSYDEATARYQRAVDIYRVCGESHPPYFLVSALNAVGYTCFLSGKLPDAESALLEGLRVAKKSLSPFENAFTYLLLHLGELYDRKGAIDLADDYYKQAIYGAEFIHTPSDPRIAVFLQPYAEFLFETGRPEDARMYQARALRLQMDAYTGGHPAVAEAEHRMAVINFALQKKMDIYSTLKGAFFINEQFHAMTTRLNYLRDATESLDDARLLSVAQAVRDEASNTYSLLLRQDESPEMIKRLGETILRSKAQVWDALAGRTPASYEPINSSVALVKDSLKLVMDELSRAFVYTVSRSNVDFYAHRLDSLQRVRRQLFDRLSWTDTTFAAHSNVWDCGLHQVVFRLPRKSAVIEYVAFDRRDGFRRSVPSYLAFVIKPDSTFRVFDLGPAQPIDSLVLAYQAVLNRPNNLDIDSDLSTGKRLRELIWDPVVAMVSAESLIFIAPDGPLNLVSFAGLPAENNEFLIEQWMFHYFTSGRDPFRLVKMDRGKSRLPGFFALANPDFDVLASLRLADNLSAVQSNSNVRSGCVNISEEQWLPLPGSQSECDGAVQLWQAHTHEQVSYCYADRATEENFKAMAPRHGILYLATHAFTTGAECVQDSSAAMWIRENPLLQSGFVLSGANLKGAGADSLGIEDGIVTAEEITTLDLRGTDLCVLSGCATGVGGIVTGEGVYSLKRAFEIAGVRTIVSSLWPVDDAATADMMKALFDPAAQSFSAALHRAQLQELQRRRARHDSIHPYYWAGFVASGDWRTGLNGAER